MSKFTRRPDWQERLADCATKAQLLPFMYGVNDCCLWTAHCIDSMCGTDLARQVQSRLNYSNEETANALIEAHGGLQRLVAEFLGEPERGAFAAPGDVVLARQDDGPPLIGVVIGHHIVAPGPHGPASLPVSNAVLFWRV